MIIIWVQCISARFCFACCFSAIEIIYWRAVNGTFLRTFRCLHWKMKLFPFNYFLSIISIKIILPYSPFDWPFLLMLITMFASASQINWTFKTYIFDVFSVLIKLLIWMFSLIFIFFWNSIRILQFQFSFFCSFRIHRIR